MTDSLDSRSFRFLDSGSLKTDSITSSNGSLNRVRSYAMRESTIVFSICAAFLPTRKIDTIEKETNVPRFEFFVSVAVE